MNETDLPPSPEALEAAFVRKFETILVLQSITQVPMTDLAARLSLTQAVLEHMRRYVVHRDDRWAIIDVDIRTCLMTNIVTMDFARAFPDHQSLGLEVTRYFVEDPEASISKAYDVLTSKKLLCEKTEPLPKSQTPAKSDTSFEAVMARTEQLIARMEAVVAGLERFVAAMPKSH